MDAPLELVAEILLQLREDDTLYHDRPSLSASKEALHACSLVCHSWRRFAQEQLFHDVVYSYHHNAEATRAELEGGRWGLYPNDSVEIPRPRKTFAMLVSFLESKSHILRYISRLSLICHADSYDFIEDSTGWEACFDEVKDSISTADFARILRLLPKLNTLHLHDVFFDKLNFAPDLSDVGIPILQLQISFSFPLYEGVVCRHRDIIAILRNFSSIDDFHVQHTYMPMSSKSIMRLAPSVGVNTLTLSDCGSETGAIYQIVAFCKPVPRLIMKFRRRMDTPYVRDILLRLAPTLRDLSLIYPEVGFIDIIGPHPDLSPCTQLHTLALGIHLFDIGFEERGIGREDIQFIANAVRTVQTISSPLRTFRFTIGAYAPCECGRKKARTQATWDSLAVHLAPVDAALVELARRCGLGQVTIEFYTSSTMRERVEDMVVAAFPQLASEGLMNMERFGMDDIRSGLCSYWNGQGGMC